MLLHYRRSGYGGFTLDTFNTDINSYSQKFEKIEGNSTDSYAVILLSSNIAHSSYDNIIFLNDLEECEITLKKWLSQNYDTEPMMEKHFYGSIVDIKNDKELGYGDSWSDGTPSWHTFSGIEQE